MYLAGLPSAAPPAGASPPRTAPPPPSRPDTPTATPDPGRSTSSAAAAFWQPSRSEPAAPTRHSCARSRERSRPRWQKNTSKQGVPGRRRSRPSPPIRRSSRRPRRERFAFSPAYRKASSMFRSGAGTGHSLVIAIPAGAGDVVVGRCRMPDDGGRNPWCEVQWRGHIGRASGCCMVDVRTGAFPRAGE